MMTRAKGSHLTTEPPKHPRFLDFRNFFFLNYLRYSSYITYQNQLMRTQKFISKLSLKMEDCWKSVKLSLRTEF